MAKIHYNLYIWRTQKSKEAEEVPETNTYQCHIQNHIRGCHAQYTGTLSPLQYLITSYNTGNRATYVLQWWIKATIYNDEPSISGRSVAEHKKSLHNLG